MPESLGQVVFSIVLIQNGIIHYDAFDGYLILERSTCILKQFKLYLRLTNFKTYYFSFYSHLFIFSEPNKCLCVYSALYNSDHDV